MDDLIARVNVMNADGPRALGAMAVLQVLPMRRLIRLGNFLVDPQSPPLASFLLALQLFTEAFQYASMANYPPTHYPGQGRHRSFYAITSLTAEKAGPDQLLALSRAHWGIENHLYHIRDVTCREDQARTNAGHAPQVLAALRNTALTVIRRLGFKPVEGFEHFAEHRQDAINTVTHPRTE
jgi:hypothetical protein